MKPIILKKEVCKQAKYSLMAPNLQFNWSLCQKDSYQI